MKHKQLHQQHELLYTTIFFSYSTLFLPKDKTLFGSAKRTEIRFPEINHLKNKKILK